MDARDLLINRAITRYRNAVNRIGGVPQQPSVSLSEVRETDGMTHVILRNINGVIAVYKVTEKLYQVSQEFWPDGI